MLVVFLLVLLIWVVLMGFLALGTIFLQGYLYTEPGSQLYWRAPAAATAITLYLAVWMSIDYWEVKRNTNAHYPYGPIQEMAPAITKTDTTPYSALFVPGEGEGAEDVKYEKKTVTDARKGHIEYLRDREPIPSTPPKLIVEENGEKIVFEPDRDSKGNYKRESGQPLLYRDSKGRVLTEGPSFERRTSFPFWRFLFGALLNVVFLGVWFVSLWLLLRYQLWHALGLAVVLYGIMLLFIVAPVMSSAEKVAAPGRSGGAGTSGLRTLTLEQVAFVSLHWPMPGSCGT